ncbi:hypothetical protein SARC_09365 [Sphaeroforma arctica JP610]|uniref:Glycoside-hydrolase family GH114 TIM-barrel domain-containing protein n=1 Tax=Sphaeroforma arctica JP610 TaxID=667725 RepID=A0A0L0FN37_9EUKA|nr:hypothetical protein SARC_09365 [Sphaeroforma arctica JP610]KNC78195.1 hypothetical protein SARC_09365 [Sphaeroforma arctica JP610]|eukprot:XP_014152097.1 hypothetical protein SARC_09365 [Sphaeroforma arctica JP610]
MMNMRTPCALLALASYANAKAISGRGAGSSAPSICNLAWSNSGAAKSTDCTGAEWIFSSSSDNSDVVTAGLADSFITSMIYLSVGTVHVDNPADPRLNDYIWQANDDLDGDGKSWGDYWFDPDDLVSKILPIMKDIMDDYKAKGYDAVSTDNAKPSTAVSDNDEIAARAREEQTIDQRYVDYMNGIVDYAHSIGLKVALKNPSYYTQEDTLIHKFDAYIVESMFNWYPSDVNNYNSVPDLLTGSKPFWVFQYEEINEVSNSELRERMVEQGVDMTYMDTSHGWVEFYATD